MAGQPVTTSRPPIPRNTPAAITLAAIPTPTHGPGGSFSIISALPIAAPPETAIATLLEHTAWPAWNRFVRRVTINATPTPSLTTPPAPASDASPLDKALAADDDDDDGARYIKKGMTMTFQVHLDPDDAASSTSQGMEVTVLERCVVGARAGWRVAWRGTSIPAVLLRTERVQEFVDDGAGGTEYTCWETMYGPLAPVVRWTTGTSLEKGFEAWGVDLKARAEKAAQEGGALGTTSTSAMQ